MRCIEVCANISNITSLPDCVFEPFSYQSLCMQGQPRSQALSEKLEEGPDDRGVCLSNPYG